MKFMHRLQDEFSKILTSYDEYKLIIGILLLGTSTLGFIIYVWAFVRNFIPQGISPLDRNFYR